MQIKCPAFDDWSEGVVDEVKVLPCASGLRILTCSETGQWIGDPDTCCTRFARPGCLDTTFCPADGKWPFTVPGTLQTASCPAGYEGAMTRYCSASGAWGEVNMSGCCSGWRVL